MKEKRKDCLYCGKEMKDVKTVRKKFCSDLCRVNFNNEIKYQKQLKEILSNPIFNKIKSDVFRDLLIMGEVNMELPMSETENKPITAPKKEKQVNTPPKQKEVKFGQQVAAKKDISEVKHPIISEETGMPVKMVGESGIDYQLRVANWKEQLKNKQ